MRKHLDTAKTVAAWAQVAAAGASAIYVATTLSLGAKALIDDRRAEKKLNKDTTNEN